jgi:hypothetical protein
VENIEVMGSKTLSLGPGLTLQFLFHWQFECRSKVSEIGYYLVKLGSKSQDLQDLIMRRVYLTKNMNSSNKTQVRQIQNWAVELP